MKNLLIIFLLSVSLNLFGQNLVLNPSFEDYIICPITEGDIDKCKFWHTAYQSPDFFHTCTLNPQEFSTPTNLWGFQVPKSGNAYASIVNYGRYVLYKNAHEHLRGTLKNTLVLGQKYYVSFSVSLTVSPILTCATNNIGAWFTTVPYLYLFPDSVFPSPVNNQAQINCSDIISDTLNWTKIFGSFIADSSYSYIIIGNFFDDDLIDTLMLDTLQNYCQSMYYIDDVCVSTDSIYAFNYVYTGILENGLETSIEVFPNPVKDNLFISTKDKSNIKISVLNVYSKTLMVNKSFINETFQINISNLEAGFYILVIELDKSKQIFKILKQ